jgi:hypothetical protein
LLTVSLATAARMATVAWADAQSKREARNEVQEAHARSGGEIRIVLKHDPERWIPVFERRSREEND